MVTGLTIIFCGPCHALSLEDTVLYVLETNPEITAAESNKQAIEFELDQAQSFFYPRLEFEGWAGASVNNGSTLSDVTAADSAITGYSVLGRITQTLLDGGERRAEIDRQAYRVDAAAFRVLERSEVLSLEAIRLYADVLRTRELVHLARGNLSYHRTVRDRLDNAYRNGVVPIGDLQQAEERVFLAQETLLTFQLGSADVDALFLEVVGVAPSSLNSMPGPGRAMPASLDQALSVARQKNPTILFAKADVGAAEALLRVVSAARSPDLNIEADAIYGENLNGFEGRTSDARIGLVLRYEFQGNRKKAAREEHVRRVSEARAHLLTQTRLVEREVRQTWTNMTTVRQRVHTVSELARLARDLRATYEEEYRVGGRSLLDILNTQNALFQAEVNLVNQRSLERYVGYRLLAAAGVLLQTLNIPVPEDARPYAGESRGVPGLQFENADSRNTAASFRDWRKSLDN